MVNTHTGVSVGQQARQGLDWANLLHGRAWLASSLNDSMSCLCVTVADMMLCTHPSSSRYKLWPPPCACAHKTHTHVAALGVVASASMAYLYHLQLQPARQMSNRGQTAPCWLFPTNPHTHMAGCWLLHTGRTGALQATGTGQHATTPSSLHS